MAHQDPESLAYRTTAALAAARDGKAPAFRSAAWLAFNHPTMPTSGAFRVEMERATNTVTPLPVAAAIALEARKMDKVFSAHERTKMLHVVCQAKLGGTLLHQGWP